MFSKLADKAFGFLDATFFATGMVPALLLAIVVSLDARGDASGISETIAALSKGDIKAQLLVAAFAVVGLSIVFYLFASSFVELYSEPFWFWEHPRSAMAARQRAAVDAINQQLALEEARYSAMELYFAANDDTGYYAPPAALALQPSALAEQAAGARRALCALGAGGHATYTQRREVEDAIFGMYASRRGLPPAQDPTAWREWRDDKALTSTIQRLKGDIEADIQRRMTVLLQRRDAFPPANEIRGTRLGNVLGAMDAYGEHRYRIPSGVLWDRIWWLLGKDQRGDVGNGKTRVEVLVECSFVMLFSFALVAGHAAVLAADSIRAEKLLPGVVERGIAAALLLPTGWLFYTSAVRSAQALSQLVRSVVDTKVLALVRSMGFAPKTVGELDALLGELRVFLLEGLPLPPDRILGSPAPAGSSKSGAASKGDDE